MKKFNSMVMNRYDPKLVEACRETIRKGIKEAGDKFGVDLSKIERLESNCENNQQYLRFLSNLVQSVPPRSGFQIMANLNLIEHTPEACVVKYGERLFDKVTIAFAELHLQKYGPLNIIKKIRA